MDESTDISGTARVAVFVRAINDNFEVIEELLGLELIHMTTKGIDLFETLKVCVQRYNIDWAKLDSVCTDGAPALTGKKSGCLALLEKFLDRTTGTSYNRLLDAVKELLPNAAPETIIRL